MSTLNISTITELPTSNIFEDWYTKFELHLISDIDSSLISSNSYIDKYYKNTNKVIKISDLFDRYVKCGGIHTITSEDEFNLFLDLDGVPLTKKYYYTLNSTNNIEHLNNNKFKIEVSINVYDLIYNNFFKHNLFSNNYLISQSYLNSLSLNSIVNINLIFNDKEFTDIINFEEYTNSSDFTNDFLGHLNCVLFDDIIIWAIINNNIDLTIVTEIGFGNKFIFQLNEIDFFLEGDLDSFAFKITNDIDGTILNEFNLDIFHVPLYKNIIFIKSYDSDNAKVIYEMCMLDRFNPITSDELEGEYYDLVLSNDYFFKNYTAWASAKLYNKVDMIYAKFYSDSIFNNLYQVETIESPSYNIINVQTDFANNPRIVKSYPFSTLEEKFKINAVITHNANLKNIKDYINNPNIFIDYSFSDSTSIIGNLQNGVINKNDFGIKSPVIKNETDTSVISHTQKDDIDDLPYKQPESLDTTTHGSHLEGLRFYGGARKLEGMAGDLIVPCVDGLVSQFGDENNQSVFRTLNNANISEPILSNINKYNNEFTLLFMTNKYGYLNNQMELGDFWENIYGKIIIFKDRSTSFSNMVYHVPIANQDNTNYYDSLLHVLEYNHGNVRYEVQNDTTLFCELDSTIDITNCNLSLFKITSHKKTNNWTTVSEKYNAPFDKQSMLPTIKDIKYYHNTINLGRLEGSKELQFNEQEQMSSAMTYYSQGTESYLFNADNRLNQLLVRNYLILEFIASSAPIFYFTYSNLSLSSGHLATGEYPDNIQIHQSGSIPQQLSNKGYVNGGSNINLRNLQINEGDKFYLFFYVNGGSPIMPFYVNNSTHFKISTEMDVYSFSTAPWVAEKMPAPLGYNAFAEHWGYNNHRNKINEYMSIGYPQIYKQVFPAQRLNKIKQLYWNNRTNNTALFFD